MTSSQLRSNTGATLFRLVICAAVTLVLGGCELRKDGGQQPDSQASGTQIKSAAADDAEGQAVSIIREDAGGEPVVVLPPEPLQVTVPFADGGSQMSEEAERALAGVIKSEQIKQNWPIIVGGHTDSAGNDQANLRSSRSRAEAVAAWLVEQGVNDNRITVIGFGEQNPAAPNAKPDGTPNEAGRMRNRRVDISIAPPPPPSVTKPAGGPATPSATTPGTTPPARQ